MKILHEHNKTFAICYKLQVHQLCRKYIVLIANTLMFVNTYVAACITLYKTGFLFPVVQKKIYAYVTL